MATYVTDPSTGERLKVKNTHKFRNFVVFPALAVIVLIVIIMNNSHGSTGPVPGNGPAVPGNGPAVAPPANSGTAHNVHYEITGAGTGLITYTTDANASESQANDAPLPWTQDLKIDSLFAPVVVSVQHSTGSGPVTCRITVDGKVISENHATGQYAIASCSGAIK